MAAISTHKKELDDLEKSAEQIRRDFDQYFQGLTKRPPTAAQAQLAGVMRKLKEEELREWNTQDKFRFNQIHARFVSMERMWARTLKQIEDGTYKRDKFKVAQKKKREEAAAPAATQLSREGLDATVDGRDRPDPLDAIDVDMNNFDDDAPPPPPRPVPRPTPIARPAAAAAPSSAGGGGGDLGGLTEQRLQQLHKVYIDAKRRTGEASTLTLDALRAQVAKQVPTIRAKHNCDQVDFKVVLKDGKAMLKAIPK